MSTRLSRRSFVALLALAAVTAATIHPSAAFQSKTKLPVNIDAKSLALRGYDPVAYFTSGKPTPGIATETAEHAGATYRFVNAANREAFLKEPAKYVPQYGGFCAYAAANGYKADADPSAWNIVGGKLYVNYNASVAKEWASKADSYIKSADQKWPQVQTLLPK
jgi:YHS domain-containing protein